MKNFLLISSLLVFFWSCGSENAKPTQESSNNNPPAAKPDGSASESKVEFEVFRVQVDNLLLRNEPTQKSATIVGKLQQGDLISGNGTESEAKEQAEIRGIQMQSAYYQVQTLENTPKTGWAFGGALQRLYAGSKASAPDLNRLQLFSTRLKTLNNKQLDSGKRAWEYVQSNFADASGPLADAVLIQLESYLHNLNFDGELYKITEKINWTDQDFEALSKFSFSMQKYPATQQLAAAGYNLQASEGMIFPAVDWKKIQDFFAAKVTPSMREFLTQMVKEQSEGDQDDGGLVISVENVVDRAAFWEKFNRDNPAFPLREQTKESQLWYKFTMTNGADNTPAFEFSDSDSRQVNSEFQSAWEYALSKYPGTAVAASAKKMLDAVKADGGKMGPNSQAIHDAMAKEYMANR